MNTTTETTTTIALQPGDTIEAFVALLRDVVANLKSAADMLARLQAADPSTLEKVLEINPTIPRAFLAKLVRVGERSLHPDLITTSCPAYHRIQLMPYSAQESLLRAGSVPVVTNIETGDSLRVPLVELKGDQLTQALSPTGLRPIDEQRAWLRRKLTFAAKPVQPDDVLPYTISRGKVQFRAGVTLTVKELLRIVEDAS